VKFKENRKQGKIKKGRKKEKSVSAAFSFHGHKVDVKSFYFSFDFFPLTV
jgi:hypothetical protein